MPVVAANLIRSQLDACMEELEQEAGRGRHHILCIRVAGGASKLLGLEDLGQRATLLLHLAPDAAFMAGAITHFKSPSKVPPAMRTIAALDRLEREYPPYSEEKIRAKIEACAVNDWQFALSLKGRVEEARAFALEQGRKLPPQWKGRCLEEVGATMAFLGDFNAAGSISEDPALERSRQRGVRCVMLVELFRRDRAKELQKLLDAEEVEGVDTWTRIRLALAFGGREPWEGYPYPDR